MILKKKDRQKVAIACKITSKIFENLAKQLKKGCFKTEKDIEKWLKKETYRKKCMLAFKPVIATAENGFEIHHMANDTKLKKGFLVVDFGVKYQGLCADCTRTFYLGKPSLEDVKMYNLVLTAQKTALNEVKTGVYAADLDAISRAVLIDYLWNFVHGLGHGVGKKIHKAPRVSPRSKSKLLENDIITIEPGLYFKNRFGIRIEDTVWVKKKPVVLTRFTKNLICIKR